MLVEFGLTALVLVILSVAMVVLLMRRRQQERRGAEQLRLATEEGQQIPLSLHPVIDPTLCVGSFSCIKACPEGEIIGVVDGVATLVEAAHCIGHSTCAVECPVGAIKLVFGTAERGIDLPQCDDSFESSRPGVYIIGELGGMGLIKNALRQGLVCAKALKVKLKKSQATQTLTDVVVVGGGPAGLACAVGLKEQGLDCRILEQDTVGGAIAHYPRGKVVMSEQIVMPGFGAFGRSLLSKEELMDDIRRLISSNKLDVEEGQRVVGISGDEPFLSVTTAQNQTVQCRAVVLAIGLRGTPRTLEVPGEDMSKVMYRLIEPEQYHGKRVLIVGGGDSAVEAAIQLAEESTAKVTISYRQGAFTRCKPANKAKIGRLINDGKVRALFNTRVISIEDGLVRLVPVGDDGKDLAPKQVVVETDAAGNVLKKTATGEHEKLPELRVKPEKSRSERRAPHGSIGDDDSEPDSTDPLGDKNKPKKGGDLDITDPTGDRIRKAEEAKAKKGITGSHRAQPVAGDPTRAEAAPRSSASSPGGGVDQTVAGPPPLGAPLPRPSSSGKGEPFDPARTVMADPNAPMPAAPEKKKYEKASVTGSFRAKPIDEGGPVPAAEAKRSDPTGSFKTVGPEEVAKKQKESKEKERTSTKANKKDKSVSSKSGDGGAAVSSSSIRLERQELRLKNDAVIISVGGTLPTEFLNTIGVGTKRYLGEEKSGAKQRPGGPKVLSKQQVESRSRRRLALTLFVLGVAMLVSLVLIGQEYYWLDPAERNQSPLHPFLKPSGLWGHGVGVGATTFMLANFLYALRKRWRKLKGTASIRTWLTFHMFVGIMSPLVIAFHAAFLVQNLLAVWTWVALAVVVGTGIFGRFLFGLVPAQAGKVLHVSELREQVSDMTRVIQTHMAEAKDLGRVTQIFNAATMGRTEGTFVGAVVKDPKHMRKLELNIEEAKGLFKDKQAYELYKESLLKINRAKMQIQFYAALKRIFRGWLVIHVVIAIFMVVLIGAHVGVTTYLGFRWIFSDGALSDGGGP